MLVTSDNRKWFKFVHCQYFFVFFAMQLILVPVLVPVLYRTDVQNPHPTDGDFSWLCRIPKNSLSLSLSLSLSFLTAIFPGEPGLAGFIAAKDGRGGGDNWNYETYKAPVKSSPSTNQHPTFYRPDALPVI